MHFNNVVAASLPILGALAAPRPQYSPPTISSTTSYSPLPVETEHSSTSTSYSPLAVETEHSTTTTSSFSFNIETEHSTTTSSFHFNIETEHSTTTSSFSFNIETEHTTATTSYSPLPVETEHSSPPGYSASAPATAQPSGAFILTAAKSAAPVHLLSTAARGFRLYFGGETASYCPDEIVENCPPGNTTVFGGLCSMDTEVPGGQQVYISPDGSIGYTQAHSMAIPEGANLCPFTYTSADDGSNTIGLDPAVAYGATSLMYCPTGDGSYQILANMKNATAPQGDLSQCYGFIASAEDYNGSVAAWQYT